MTIRRTFRDLSKTYADAAERLPQTVEDKTPGSRGNPRVRKRDKAEMRQTTVHLPIETFTRLRAHCAELDAGISETIAEAIEIMLAQRRKAG